MMTTMQLTDSLKTYVLLQVDNMATSTPAVGFIKPLIIRALDKNFGKVNKALDLISDENGYIDVDSILMEMIQNVTNTNPFTIETSIIGDIEIGGGQIKFNLPFTSKRLVLNTTDLEAFKEMLITKNK